MTKISVFVEGQAELIFIRHLLLNHYNWVVDINCLQLYGKGQYDICPYPNNRDDADYHYSIYNVGGDSSVISEILLHEKKLKEQGFDRIVGIRDMYSKQYRSLSMVIDNEINQKFIDGHKISLQKSTNPEDIFFSFSIMEVEAWWLGIHQVFERIHPILTPENILTNTGIDIANIDPEATIFHPVTEYKKILKLAGITYDKKLGEVEMYCSNLGNADFEYLYDVQKCNSYNTLCENLLLK